MSEEEVRRKLVTEDCRCVTQVQVQMLIDILQRCNFIKFIVSTMMIICKQICNPDFLGKHKKKVN